ncbi:cysteine desulfurase [Paenibacillus uliginis N3/975]|uniref:Cysteine desulfurase n=1 Tax=Paenibacillus uliginis N3/975 TaxID=1313296 RepID=A0A1X7HMD6_9BACL|nr:cysteine desulfurase family protein [Paenibacillus uliginis]SMF88476.1 cysteine desulfurase [Paenibacillus uliginis N3/975]
MLYWDHAATTPPYKEVVETMAEIMNQHYGNPSALHQAGEDAAKLLKRAREVCAGTLGVQSSEIVFTSGATEGNNIAIKGVAMHYRSRGQHIITTKTEHPSVYECCRQLESLGWEITYIPVDEYGVVDPLQVASVIRKDTVLVSIMHVNNETGAVQPLNEIGKLVKEKNSRTLFHVDGVQGFGKLSVSLKDWKVDLYTLSAHKFKGPKGAGILYVQQGIKLFPLLAGGSQENGQRPGTENVASAVAVAKAMRLAQERQDTFYDKIGKLRSLLLNEIRSIPDFVLNSSEKGAPHIVHFSYPGLKPEVLVHTLEELGMLVSTKSACSSRNSEPSRVLQAMGKDKEIAASGIRISMGWEHTDDDMNRLVIALRQSADKLRPLSAKRG